MTIIVFSDSHGRRDEMKRIIKKHKEAETVIFCGDGAHDIADVQAEYPEKRYFAVKGNCDWSGNLPQLITCELAGKKLLITHGHVHGVKESLSRLYYLARQENADIVCFGHTHFQLLTIESDMLIINPGSVGFSFEYTLLDIDEATGDMTVTEFQKHHSTVSRINCPVSRKLT